MADKYILDDDNNLVEEPDLIKWGQWMEEAGKRRIVAKTQVGKYLVSTVFLGLNHQWGSGPPLLFETMVFTRAHKIYEHNERLYRAREEISCDRWTTWDQAQRGHDETVKRLKEKV
jgi:hypothetical protein